LKINNKKEKVLLIQTAFLGDFILTTPVIKKLSHFYGDDKVFVVARPFASEISNCKIISFDKDKKSKKIFEFLNVLKKIISIKPQIAFVPHLSATSSLLAFSSRIPVRIGFEENPLSFLFTHKIKKYGGKFEHEVERISKILIPAGLYMKGDELKPEVFVDQSYLSKWEKFFCEVKKNYGVKKNTDKEKIKLVAFAPFSNWGTKTWVYYKEFLQTNKMKDFIFILLGQKEETGNFPHNVINLSGKTSLKDVVAIIKLSDIFLGVDNGLSHIASSFDKPSFVIFGPTVPEFGFFPLSKKFQVIEVSELECKPCSPHGPQVCPKRHFSCMKELTPELVGFLFLKFVNSENNLYENNSQN
jgi:heptosyltransferase-2